VSLEQNNRVVDIFLVVSTGEFLFSGKFIFNFFCIPLHYSVFASDVNKISRV
jgi:hypothetical protein